MFTSFGMLKTNMKIKFLIASSFKDLGWVPICTLCTAFWYWAAVSNVVATLSMTWVMPSSLRHCVSHLVFIRRMKQCRGQSGWCSELPDIETTNPLHFSSLEGDALYMLVLLISESLLSRCDVFIKCHEVISWPNLKKAAAKVHEQCRWFLLFLWRSDFFIPEVC